MKHVLRSDLFRNFLGGFFFGALALIALQPTEVRADFGEQLGLAMAASDQGTS